MMSLCVDCFPKAICEPERQARDLPIANCDRIVWQPVLVDDDVVQGYLTNNAPADVRTPIWPDCIISVSKTTPQKQLMVGQAVDYVWSCHRG